MITGKLLSGMDDLTQAYEIRKKVFMEEQGIEEEKVFDELDKDAMHVIVYEKPSASDKVNFKNDNVKAVATGRIYYNGTECRIGRVAVLKEYRGKKYGDFTVRMLLNRAFTSGINEVVIHSQLDAEQFYQKMGFEKVGENFLEAGIWHCIMKINPANIVSLCKKMKSN